MNATIDRAAAVVLLALRLRALAPRSERTGERR